MKSRRRVNSSVRRLPQMFRFLFTLMVTAVAFVPAHAQLRDFPIAWNGWEITSDAKLSGSVQTILTIEQRENRSFGSWTDVYDSAGRRISNLYESAAIEIHSNSMVRL